MYDLTQDGHEQRNLVSMPERELLGFVTVVTDLLGANQTDFLREIWLDQLASMETMPGPSSPDWRLVTQAAWVRLAGRLIDLSFVENGL
jgi:hypothetical protein